MIRHYTFSETDLSIIRQHRGTANRLGFAICASPASSWVSISHRSCRCWPLLAFIANQIKVQIESWNDYGQREQTRREHLAELQAWLNLTPLSVADFRRFVHQLAEMAQQTDHGIVLAEALVEMLRQQRIIMPAVDVIERVCSEALTRGTRQVYEALTVPLSDHHRRALDGMLTLREGTKDSGLIWLRQPPGPPKPKHVLVHLERLKTVRELLLPDGLEHAIHQNRLLKLAREGGQMKAQHLRDLEPARRYATLVAVILDTRHTD